MRVLAVDAIPPEGLVYLRERNIQVDELAKPSLETLYALIEDYDGLITRSGTSVTAELLTMPRACASSGAPESASTTSTSKPALGAAFSSATPRTATWSRRPSTPSACCWRSSVASPALTPG
jgi:hypothetical protein